ncbi:hypothetical protein AMAG_02655 [Allomyces macrogynus ATCC 38327]|uniref:Uncharacterized protein n=1 Tax=Allomyces macrogynus (strain ATCC 38327) TaxID=578462 RepID=A0A0L0S3C2_ALLM3|nr:hypothetical protein AMAG_02655 [Allomyces macrogynus ATCC 38327]|eukprot:KNE56884.1 hypothetical protein AMAG_02655 [Allomyces macrogynus ATCC 38327]
MDKQDAHFGSGDSAAKMVGMPGDEDPTSDPVLSGCTPSSSKVEGNKHGLFCKVKKLAARVASKPKQAIKQLASAISPACGPFGSRNKVTPTPVLDDSKPVQHVPDAVNLIEFIVWVRTQLSAIEVGHVECLYERTKDQVKMIDAVVASIEYDSAFPTNVEGYVKRVFLKATRTVIASILVDMLKSVLGNATTPFMAT